MKRTIIALAALSLLSVAACAPSPGAVSLGISTACGAASVAYAEYSSRKTPSVAAQVAYASVRAICDAPPDQRAALEGALSEALANFQKAAK